jgi:hypothetical protein
MSRCCCGSIVDRLVQRERGLGTAVVFRTGLVRLMRRVVVGQPAAIHNGVAVVTTTAYCCWGGCSHDGGPGGREGRLTSMGSPW